MKTKQTITKIALYVASTMFAFNANAQTEDTFSPSGKPIVTIFSNVHTGLKDVANESGFELERCYLGYEYQFSKKLSAKAIYDMGSSKVEDSDLERIGYVKNAFVQYKKSDFSAKVGLIGLTQFNLQEKFWGNRYVRKSFQDEYKYGSSADMGITASYSLGKTVSLDAIVCNGEGYKKINKDNRFRYGVGITLNPTDIITIRAYADNYKKQETDTLGRAQSTCGVFAGVETDLFSLGCEYNQMWNTKFVDGENNMGVSIYTNIKMSKKLQLFARYDNQNQSTKGNFENIEHVGLLGIQYAPVKELNISPNIEYTKTKNDDAVGFAVHMSFSL